MNASHFFLLFLFLVFRAVSNWHIVFVSVKGGGGRGVKTNGGFSTGLYDI